LFNRKEFYLFTCDKCKKITSLNEKLNLKVISTRIKNYWNVVILNFNTKKKEYHQYPKRDTNILRNFEINGFKVLKEFMTKGSEIVKEIKLCNDCNKSEDKC
jgi:radical SAM superfamily enzyme with C-terminal helix-hairpin-helix motif